MRKYSSDMPVKSAQRHFVTSVMSVLMGTTAAQALPVLGSLVLTRQYAPGEFGIFSAWLALVTFLAVVLTGRFETGLAIAENGESRRRAVFATLLTVLLATLVVCLIFLVLTVLCVPILERVPRLLLWLGIPTALLIAAMQTWQSWAAAEGKYRYLISMRIAQAASIIVLQIVAGIGFPSATALGVAHFMGVSLGLAIAAYLMPLGRFDRVGMRDNLITFWYQNRRFFLFSLPADAVNAAAAQLPVLIVAARFGAEMAGLLAMTMRVLGAPIGLLANSVLDVFKRHAATGFRERGECRAEYRLAFKMLTVAALVFSVAMAFGSKPLFTIAFGTTWASAGTVALWLLPRFAIGFVASPLSYMVYIAGKQHMDLVWQVTLLLMTVATLNFLPSESLALQVYSVGYSVLYVVYVIMSYNYSRGKSNDSRH